MNNSIKRHSLVIPVINKVTSYDSTVLASLERALDLRPTILLEEDCPGLWSALTRAGATIIAPRDLSPLLVHRNDAGERLRAVDRARSNDDLLRRLPLPGAGTLFWDRLQWYLSEHDVREVIGRLPWNAINAVEIVGGVSVKSMLPVLVAAEACRRGIDVVARVVGPVTGRWAPLWMLVATTLWVAGDDECSQLSGVAADVRVDPSLKTMPGGEPISGDVPGPLIVDQHRSTSRVMLRAVLRELAARCGGVIERFVIPGSPEELALAQQDLGASIARIPVEFTLQSLERTAETRRGSVLSLPPYRWFHGAGAGLRNPCGIPVAAQKSPESVPDRWKSFVLDPLGVPTL